MKVRSKSEDLMPERAWEKTSSRNTSNSPFAMAVKILTLGIAANPEPWIVEYTNRQTGERISARGASEADADSRARARFSNIGGTATAH